MLLGVCDPFELKMKFVSKKYKSGKHIFCVICVEHFFIGKREISHIIALKC